MRIGIEAYIDSDYQKIHGPRGRLMAEPGKILLGGSQDIGPGLIRLPTNGLNIFLRIFMVVGK